jgi:hypothetical protein
MARSNKSRHGRACKNSKDTVLGSRSQKRAWAKRKQIDGQAERARRGADVRAEATS